MSDDLALAAELHEVFQERATEFFSSPDDSVGEDELPETGVLTGWFLVCEWAAGDGRKWLTYVRPEDQPVWASRGLLTEAERDN